MKLFERMGRKLDKWRLAPSRRALVLLIYLLVALMIPNAALAITESYTGWSVIAGIFIPLGAYLVANVITRRVGITVMCMVPIIILCTFQLVLLYLYGNSIIAADMFINLLTTNPDEASELLNNLYPAVFFVCIIYAPILIEAFLQIRRKMRLTIKMQERIKWTGTVCLGIGLAALIPAYKKGSGNIVGNEIFPINVICNFNVALAANNDALHYASTSKLFRYNVSRGGKSDEREIYVYIIGEASRAANWSLYGYERETNQYLKRRDDIYLFKNVITQSNTTHKSVPLFLSSVATDQHRDLFYRKGLAALFNEAGFRTYFLSNQSPQGAMVDHLAKEANEVVYIGAPRHDMQLLRMMRRIIETDDNNDLLFILHCYGSHFSYHQRYPREFAVYQPDNDVAIQPQNADMIRNAYDNSISYTDYFLNSTIDYLDALGVCSTLIYCSDHGEDIFDDERGRFLHASPTVTYYQLHVPCLAWFSDKYAQLYPEKTAAAKKHRWSAATTHSMFHTMADMASLESAFIDRSVSFVSDDFVENAPRYYLNDHNEAVPFDKKIGITKQDRRLFAIHGIRLE